jgi:hypothetical protein
VNGNAFLVDASNIQWVCASCSTLIDSTDKLAGIILDQEQMTNAEKLLSDYAQYEREKALIGSVIDDTLRIANIVKTPEGQWVPYCSSCASTVSEAYFISVDRISTLAQVLDWTVHLMGKGWVGYTDWSYWMRKIIGTTV